MKVFQRVIDEGGFAAAARAMDMSPAVVTRLVADLEQHLGTRLLQRTTRRLSLTDAGEAYLLRVRGILHEIEDAESAAAENTRAGIVFFVAAHCHLARPPPQGAAGPGYRPLSAIPN
jgi:DNA-binding transcriptional LysR family regulator